MNATVNEKKAEVGEIYRLNDTHVIVKIVIKREATESRGGHLWLLVNPDTEYETNAQCDEESFLESHSLCENSLDTHMPEHEMGV